MKKTLLILLLLLLSNIALAELKCSANGLKVLYINGVNVPKIKNALISTKNIYDITRLIQTELDKKQVFPTTLVYNQSRSLSQDIEELKAQLAANHSGVKRQEYWKALALETILPMEDYYSQKNKIEETLEQITSKKKIVYKSDGTIDQNAYAQSDLYKDLLRYNSELARIYANSSSDIGVVEELKMQIKSAYSEGANKVIVVSHSQGNEVTYSAVQDLRNDGAVFSSEEKLKKFDSLIGYMQMAPPSPKLVTSVNPPEIGNYYPDHAQYILLDNDRVIAGTLAMTGFSPMLPNYYANIPDTVAMIRRNGTLSELLLSEIFTYRGGSALYHGMDDSYLNANSISIRSDTTTNQSMVAHFKDNMREIANKLEDNCNLPVIKFNSVNVAVDSSGIMQVSGTAGPGKVITINLEDVALSEIPSEQLKLGYNRENTIFSWKVEREYPFDKKLPYGMVTIEESEGKTIELQVPYRDLKYFVTVTAKNEYNKEATVTKNFEIKANLKPEISLVDSQCQANTGRYNFDTQFLSLKIIDDQFYLDGNIFSTLIPYDKSSVVISQPDGQDTESVTIQNGCPISFRYEIWSMCQIAACYHFSDNEDGCNWYETTGLQYNEIRFFNQNQEPVGKLGGAEVMNGQTGELSSFYNPYDPTDPPVLTTYDGGNSCKPRIRTLPEAQLWFKQ